MNFRKLVEAYRKYRTDTLSAADARERHGVAANFERMAGVVNFMIKNRLPRNNPGLADRISRDAARVRKHLMDKGYDSFRTEGLVIPTRSKDYILGEEEK